MRIRVAGRFIVFAVLAALLLSSLPAVTPIAQARPIGWDDPKPDGPAGGDNDGVVLKSPRAISGREITTQTYGGTTAISSTYATGPTSLRHGWTALRGYVAAMRLNYWLFWTR